MAKQQQKLTVIGAGVWGKALADLAQRNQRYAVNIWSRQSAASLETAIAKADFVLSAVSMKGVCPTIEHLQGILPEGAVIITATKGLDPETRKTPSQLWQEAFPNHAVVVLSGPNLSKEIQQRLPAATVVSSANERAAIQVQDVFASDRFRVYVNPDPLGTELGGTLKNVMAIAAGVCGGMQLGTNAKAGLLTRALPEMIRLGTYLGAQPETFFGLSGLGDLIATCDGVLSRNYQVGYGLAQGKTLEEILLHLEGTAEGINTANVVVAIAAKANIPVPIASEVYRLLHGQSTTTEAMQNLMDRELKREFEGIKFQGG